MIILIITLSILLIGVILLLSHRWEKHIDEFFYYDENGSLEKGASRLVDYETSEGKKLLIEILKQKYPGQFKKYLGYADKKLSKEEQEKYVLEDWMRAYSVPCRREIKTSIRLDSDWNNMDCYPVSTIGGWVVIICSAIGLCICAGNVIFNKVEWAIKAEEVSYNTKIENLEANRSAILSYYESSITKDIDISATNIPQLIKEHNDEVATLVKRVKQERINLSNPWINIYVNPACENIDLPRIEASYINLN